MTQSMTAYSQANLSFDFGELSCELRSVNHRYLEIAPRMPEELRIHESALRELIGTRLSRGRVDCFIRLTEGESNQMEPNAETTAQLNKLLLKMRTKIPDMQDIRAIDVLRWPGVLQAKKIDSDQLKAALLEVAALALEDMQEARAREGAKMAELIEYRLTSIEEIIDGVKAFLPEIADLFRQRLEEKLADIKDQLEPNRVEQEMVMFLQKTDVAEELDRLNTHVDEVRAVLAKPEPAGRRLDFLMQELNREANTLGSKSQDTRLTKASVDLKVLIEQMREQVQNIE